jgi:hypothetical protein
MRIVAICFLLIATMPSILTKQTKRLAGLRQHIVAWQDALFSAEQAVRLFQNSNAQDQRIARELSYYAFIAYGRPFTANQGLAGIKEAGDKDLVKIRNEISAHTDAVKHVYLAHVEIVGGKVVRDRVPTTNLLPFMQPLIVDSRRLIEAIAIEIEDLQNDIDKLGLSDGIYGN